MRFRIGTCCLITCGGLDNVFTNWYMLKKCNIMPGAVTAIWSIDFAGLANKITNVKTPDMIHGPHPAGLAGTWTGPWTTFQTTTHLKTSFCDYPHANIQTDTSSTTEDTGTVGNASRSCTASKREIQSLLKVYQTTHRTPTRSPECNVISSNGTKWNNTGVPRWASKLAATKVEHPSQLPRNS